MTPQPKDPLFLCYHEINLNRDWSRIDFPIWIMVETINRSHSGEGRRLVDGQFGPSFGFGADYDVANYTKRSFHTLDDVPEEVVAAYMAWLHTRQVT